MIGTLVRRPSHSLPLKGTSGVLVLGLRGDINVTLTF